ncbi:hypothetical protein Tco_0066597 [Tanacetum coccineum]
MHQTTVSQNKDNSHAWHCFEQLETHLRDLYLNSSSHAVDAFKPAFHSFFGEEHQTFRVKMFHNLDQLRLQLERDNLLEVNPRTCLEALRTQFKEFFASKRVNSSEHLNQCQQKDFKEYTFCEPDTYRRDLLENLDTLEAVIHKAVITYGRLQLLSQDVQINPVQAVDDRLIVSKSSGIESENNNALSKSVNETQLQQHESLVTESTTVEVNLNTDVKALDAGSVITESSRTKSDKHDSSSSSRTYITHAVDADIRPVNDQVPFAEVQLTAQHNVLANEQQHTEQSEPIYDTYLLDKVDSNTTPDSTNMCHRGGEIDQDAELYQAKSPLLKAEFLKTNDMVEKEVYNELSNRFLQLEKHCISLEISMQQKEIINSKTDENADLKAQIQEKVFVNVALKNELRKLKGNSVDTKFAKPSILGKPVLQPPRNQSAVRQPNACKSERPNFSKPRFASHVDVNNVLSKPATPHYLPKVREYVLEKPHHVIAPGSSRNSQEEPYGSNDMAHNHYLEEARKKTQERNRNSKPSVMHTTSLQNTTNGSKPNPRSNNQISRSLPVSRSSCGMSNGVSLVDHSRNSSSFSDSKHFVCSTCHKCVFNANHDNCITKFLKEVNSRAKVQSSKTRNNNKPVEPKNHTQKSGRQIAIGQRFSPKKSSAVWIPTRKMFTDNTTKVDNEPPNGSNDDITNPYECDQTLNVSAGLVPQSPSPTPNVPPTKNDWDSLFCPMFDEYFNPSPSVVQPVLVAGVQEPVVSTAGVQEPVVSTGTPSSTRIDQDTPSTSTSQTTQEEQSHVIPTSVEEDNHVNQPQEHIEKWTKDHPLDKIIGDPSRPVSTRLQLQTEALFCYYDALLSSSEHKSYKDALTESCWIDAMKSSMSLNIWRFGSLQIKEQKENGVVELYFVGTEFQLADIFSRPLGQEKLEFLMKKLNASRGKLWNLLKDEEACLTTKFYNFPKVQVNGSGITTPDFR